MNNEFTNKDGEQPFANTQPVNIQEIEESQPVQSTEEVKPQIMPEPQMVQNIPIVEKKKGKGLVIALIIGIIAIIAIGIFAYMKFFSVTPYKYFQTTMDTYLNEAFKNIRDDKVYEYEFSLDLDLQLKEDLNKDVMDYLNNSVLKATAQFDKDNKKIVAKIDSSYKGENDFRLSAFMDKDKLFVYAPDFYSKYVEVGGVDYTEYVDIFEETIDFNTVAKILKREIPKMIKEEDCSKDGEFYVLKINNGELRKRLVDLLNNLKNDKDFVNALGGEESFISIFDNDFTYEEPYETYDIIIRLNDKAYSITTDDIIISGEIKGDTTTFKIIDFDEHEANGSITSKGNAENNTVNFVISGDSIGTIKIDLNSKYRKLSKVDEVDKNNVIKSEEISEEEANEIAEKESKTKLYTFIDNYFFGQDDYEYEEPGNYEI